MNMISRLIKYHLDDWCAVPAVHLASRSMSLIESLKKILAVIIIDAQLEGVNLELHSACVLLLMVVAGPGQQVLRCQGHLCFLLASLSL